MIALFRSSDYKLIGVFHTESDAIASVIMTKLYESVVITRREGGILRITVENPNRCLGPSNCLQIIGVPLLASSGIGSAA